MPVVSNSDYRPPGILLGGHLQTIYPALLRPIRRPEYLRERIDTPDNDFLDLDWIQNGYQRLAIISHGLEGNSTRPYMSGMAKAFLQNGFDVLAWNYRGCSEEQNLFTHSYHSGATRDLETVVNHALTKGYKDINLVGFSLGGNLTLKYLGEEVTTKPPELSSAVVLSVPLDLYDCAIQIHKRSNFLYEQRFLRSFRRKIRLKAAMFDEVDVSRLKSVRSVYDFDELYTAPLNGYKSAIHYYDECSSIRFIHGVQVPTLVMNALNDPFLGSKCFDPVEFSKSTLVTLDLTAEGGHCGFPLFNNDGRYWSEMRAVEFAERYS